jgi:pyrroloquinoline quinone biosynthesis protein D
MSALAIDKPCFAPGVRLGFDKVREQHILLYPEGAVTLNETAVKVLELCDGNRTLDDIANELADTYGASSPDLKDDISELIAAIAARGLVVDAAD